MTAVATDRLVNKQFASRLFPESDTGELRYALRGSYFRFAFFIATTSLFVLLFAGVVAWLLLFGDEGGHLPVAIAGLLISPAFPAIYLIRYLRSGYAVTGTTLYMREGFLHERTRDIAISSIKKAEAIREQRFNLPGMGHIKLQLDDGSELFLLDAQQPQRLLDVLRQG